MAIASDGNMNSAATQAREDKKTSKREKNWKPDDKVFCKVYHEVQGFVKEFCERRSSSIERLEQTNIAFEEAHPGKKLTFGEIKSL